jgi:hypothetical protein
MEMNFENQIIYTGGRDGSIFRTSLLELDEIPASPETEN